MSRVNLEDNISYGLQIGPGMKLQSMTFVPADNAALDPDSPPWVIMDPAGAIDLLMPAVTAGMKGLMFFMSNISASAITLKTSADAAFTTAIVLGAGESAWVICTGSATAALGWRAGATAAST